MFKSPFLSDDKFVTFIISFTSDDRDDDEHGSNGCRRLRGDKKDRYGSLPAWVPGILGVIIIRKQDNDNWGQGCNYGWISIYRFEGQESRSAILGALKVLTEIIATGTRRRWYSGRNFGAIGAYTCTSGKVLIEQQFVHHLCIYVQPVFTQTSIICHYGEVCLGKNDRVKTITNEYKEVLMWPSLSV